MRRARRGTPSARSEDDVMAKGVADEREARDRSARTPLIRSRDRPYQDNPKYSCSTQSHTCQLTARGHGSERLEPLSDHGGLVCESGENCAFTNCAWSSCLVPRCGGETIGLTAKETLWEQVLHGSATTTHAIRAAIQRSKA